MPKCWPRWASVIDSADYSASGTGVNVDLGAGQATGGDAEGDKPVRRTRFEAAPGTTC
jgi:hypothetical protein